MNIDSAVISAGISALISIAVNAFSFYSSRQAQKQAMDRFEREFRNGYTSRLYDLRLKSYPQAFDITEALRSELLYKYHDLVALKAVRERISAWHAAEAGFLLSRGSISALRTLADALDMAMGTSPARNDALKAVWEAKNRFRRALRNDVHLMYADDPDAPTSDTTANSWN